MSTVRIRNLGLAIGLCGLIAGPVGCGGSDGGSTTAGAGVSIPAVTVPQAANTAPPPPSSQQPAVTTAGTGGHSGSGKASGKAAGDGVDPAQAADEASVKQTGGQAKPSEPGEPPKSGASTIPDYPQQPGE